MRRFFPERPRNLAALPGPVIEWMKQDANADRPGYPLRPHHALVRERRGERLRLRMMSGPCGGHILALGLETNPRSMRLQTTGGLTRREIDVLLQVETGKTNEEVAAALGISPLTVRTHLEHIFDKLRVPSRTAAVTRFRGFVQH
jgi:DNA-binding CsgD family transcriptional regulator